MHHLLHTSVSGISPRRPRAFPLTLLRTAAAALILIAVVVAPYLSPATAEASLLPAIADARDLSEREANTAPVLRKHFVEVSPGVFLAVKGKRERRQVRMARWVDGLQGDRAAVFGKEGLPTFRHQELETGRVREIWSYPQSRVTYIFEGNRLHRRMPF